MLLRFKPDGDAKFQLEMNPNEDIIIFPSHRFPKFSLQSPPLSLRGKSWALGSVFVLSSAVSASYDFGHVTWLCSQLYLVTIISLLMLSSWSHPWPLSDIWAGVPPILCSWSVALFVSTLLSTGFAHLKVQSMCSNTWRIHNWMRDWMSKFSGWVCGRSSASLYGITTLETCKWAAWLWLDGEWEGGSFYNRPPWICTENQNFRACLVWKKLAWCLLCFILGCLFSFCLCSFCGLKKRDDVHLCVCVNCSCPCVLRPGHHGILCRNHFLSQPPVPCRKPVLVCLGCNNRIP